MHSLEAQILAFERFRRTFGVLAHPEDAPEIWLTSVATADWDLEEATGEAREV